MPLPIPTRRGVVDTLRNYVRDALPEIDPTTERRSLVGGLVKSLGSALADFYIALKRYADREPFPQTATGAFLKKGWWVDITKLQQNPAAAGRGYVAIEGTNGTAIPAGLQLVASNVTYQVQRSSSIVPQPIAASTLTTNVDGDVCTFTSLTDHSLATGMQVTISGATPSAYNGTFTITVTGLKTFTYEPASTPGSAGTGSIVATATFALVLIEATTSGQNTNLSSGARLSLSNAPSGASTTAYVGFGGIAGGTDAETEDSYRERILEALGTDFGMFSAAEIKIVAKTVPGVTRVMVREASLFGANGVNEGQVKIAFLRDDDANPLPDAQEVADVRAKIMDLELPAHTAPEDVMVMSPPPYTVDFEIASITPDTPGMRRAVLASLKQFFREGVEWGATIPEDDYRCAILGAYDFETRQKLRAFDLTSPTGDIEPGEDEYPVLGSVTYG